MNRVAEKAKVEDHDFAGGPRPFEKIIRYARHVKRLKNSGSGTGHQPGVLILCQW